MNELVIYTTDSTSPISGSSITWIYSCYEC